MNLEIGPNCPSCEAASAGVCPAFNLLQAFDRLSDGSGTLPISNLYSCNVETINRSIQACRGKENVGEFVVRLGQAAGSVATKIMVLDGEAQRINKATRDFSNNEENIDPKKLKASKDHRIGFYPYPDSLASSKQINARKALFEAGVLV
ncbi:MAG: hypothetical protein H6799_00100 [Candidatus Nomurabacteria bacterium]|nr:MAG: hypothetical protein H6799_00100 [Candidatus Nomurabacteria bacterium]HRV76033.1 hypothetical protein [Candidatus Saccharimonadales bacterium]